MRCKDSNIFIDAGQEKNAIIAGVIKKEGRGVKRGKFAGNFIFIFSPQVPQKCGDHRKTAVYSRAPIYE